MTNEQAIAYAVLAMRDAGIPVDKAREIADDMRWQMDKHTAREAQAIADRWVEHKK